MDVPAIDVQNLVRDYGALRAVAGISFQVRRGEIFGFLGPNGAGKTTTVRMLTTLLEPTSGKAFLNGYDVVQESYAARQQFGLVPEESNLYRELSAIDNLRFSGRLYLVPAKERERRARELLALFGLGDRQQSRVETFSRGMRRKVTIAMALVHRPSILFLDEPTAGLDVQSARAILDLVRQLNAQGTTIFLTTHQIEEANQLCDRVAIIHGGRIAAIDAPERLKRAFESVQSVEVALDPWPADAQETLGATVGVTAVAKHGDKLRLYTADPSHLLPVLVAYAQERGSRLVALNTLGPSLEDVFLRITGQPLGARQPEERAEGGPHRGPRGRDR